MAVYVHGGGFEFGANTQITSNAAGLAASGRVVGVSVNYRLGALGALSLSQYGGRLAEASNLFLQDVIAALTWVKRNIAHFGGDPDQVTVYGHSSRRLPHLRSARRLLRRWPVPATGRVLRRARS